jgi:formylmethanofuran dehydrogenase subunit B
MAARKYGVVFFGLSAQVSPRECRVLLRLVAELNRHPITAACEFRRRHRGRFGSLLADGISAVNSRRISSLIGEFTANDLLTRGEADARVLVGSESVASLRTAQLVAGQLPTIADYRIITRRLRPLLVHDGDWDHAEL